MDGRLATTVVWAATTLSGSTDDSPALVAGTPSSRATASARERARSAPAHAMPAPLMQMAERNRPRAGGDVSRAAQATPPADCPASVTREGSPPNAPMFSCTHSRAASQSRTARLRGAPSTARKPSAPRR